MLIRPAFTSSKAFEKLAEVVGPGHASSASGVDVGAGVGVGGTGVLVGDGVVASMATKLCRTAHGARAPSVAFIISSTMTKALWQSRGYSKSCGVSNVV